MCWWCCGPGLDCRDHGGERLQLLLDLHNLHANATNFGFDPLQFLAEIPIERVQDIHIAGGRWISSPDGDKQYLLDDHLHALDQPVYDLLSEVAARAAQPLTVILERDGAYPPMPVLLQELERARARWRSGAAGGSNRASPMQDRLERVMARLLSDTEFRRRFRTDPRAAAAEEGLSPEAVAAVTAISVPDLETAARSYAAKRRAKRGQARPSWLKGLFE